MEAELTKTVAELKAKNDELKDEKAGRRAAEEVLTRLSVRSADRPEFMEGLLTTDDQTEGENGHPGGRMTKSLIDVQDEETQKDRSERRQSIGHGIRT